MAAERNEHQSGSEDDARDSGAVESPPLGLFPTLRRIGPGLIVAGSIVGSGELIATTKAGAEAGFTLLWLILLGCLVKVFAQVELGRYAIISGRTTLRAMDEVPGPRINGRGNWLVWYWLVMWLASISQLGGIVGSVGQSLAIATPITQLGIDSNELAQARSQIALGEARKAEDIQVIRRRYEDLENDFIAKHGSLDVKSKDAVIWAGLMAVITSLILLWGRYGMIQSLSTVLVASFTLLTIGNLFLLQNQPDFQVTLKEFWSGLTLGLPEVKAGSAPIATALATFGIIGVGAAELVVYPYWCLEKGYAKFVGPRPDPSSPEAVRRWTERASGWMRVMRFDAWGAMAVYTFATVAFYLLGAATLWRMNLNPADSDLISTLAMMYVPVFGKWASVVFLFGAFAVLYSTFFVANASHARTFSDAMRVIGLIAQDEQTRQRWVKILSAVFPLLCWLIYVYFPKPAQLVLISGVAQGVMLPMMAYAALFFRYRRGVDGLRPGKLWDAMLWLSALAMLVTGLWTIINKINSYGI